MISSSTRTEAYYKEYYKKIGKLNRVRQLNHINGNRLRHKNRLKQTHFLHT